ncbi:2-oxo-4-hydroxy-4-carboxy-5-ureidoimidazoline decarboxylase [Streptomyces sp. NPDC093064]|uniref:2-oxo-4-hydroxy-4-carboxy-5-ureidoimidazoline decarboxylase n=1 Tax=Streptomyces sp. NPDC093064 TaxID=3366020 RepID=UPI00381ABBA6
MNSAAGITDSGLAIVNSMPSEELVQTLFDSCHLPVLAWAENVEAARPYDTVEGLLSRATSAVGGLSQEEVVAAHTGLTRIGAPIAGTDVEARWSRSESAGVGTETELLASLAAANEAYEERFGHVFLISATGLSGWDIVEAIRARLENDEAAETEQIKSELKKLMAIRLPKLLHELAEPGTSH